MVLQTLKAENLKPEIQLVKFMVNYTVEKKNFNLDKKSVDWNKLKNIIIYHELIPFAYLYFKNSLSAPAPFKNFLRDNYYHILSQCAKIYYYLKKLLKVFKEKKIIVVPIKGASFLLDIYEDKFVRPMVDIDLLIKEEDFNKASFLPYSLGYKKNLEGLKEEYWREKQMHISFYLKKDKKIINRIELHWSLDYKRKGKNIFPELWKRLRQVKVDTEDIFLLSPEDNFLSLVLHNRRFGKVLCLKNVCDGILILNKYKNFDWDYILKICDKYSLYTSLFFFVSQINFLNENIVPQIVQQRLREKIFSVKRKIINNFIRKNTFDVNSNFPQKLKHLFLKSHFLLYDNILEPINYILNIPLEQFAKYYNMEPYSEKTKLLYRLRFFYIPFRMIRDFLLK